MSALDGKEAADALSDLHVKHAGDGPEIDTMRTLDDRIRNIRRKVDSRLCIVVAVLYAVAQLDRQNLGYA